MSQIYIYIIIYICLYIHVIYHDLQTHLLRYAGIFPNVALKITQFIVQCGAMWAPPQRYQLVSKPH